MRQEILSALIADEVSQVYAANLELIQSQVFSHLPRDTANPEAVAGIVVNAMQLSTQFSVNCVLRVLEQAGVISFPPDGQSVLEVLPSQPQNPESEPSPCSSHPVSKA